MTYNYKLVEYYIYKGTLEIFYFNLLILYLNNMRLRGLQ